MKEWRAHVVLAVLIAVEVVAGIASHRSDAELARAAEGERGAARRTALFRLAQRDEDGPLPVADSELLASPDPLTRELAFTTALCRPGSVAARNRWLRDRIDAGELDGDFWRAFVIHRRKVGGVIGGSTKLKRQELDWFLDAVAGRALPIDAVAEYVRRHP